MMLGRCEAPLVNSKRLNALTQNVNTEAALEAACQSSKVDYWVKVQKEKAQLSRFLCLKLCHISRICERLHGK